MFAVISACAAVCTIDNKQPLLNAAHCTLQIPRLAAAATLMHAHAVLALVCGAHADKGTGTHCKAAMWALAAMRAAAPALVAAPPALACVMACQALILSIMFTAIWPSTGTEKTGRSAAAGKQRRTAADGQG